MDRLVAGGFVILCTAVCLLFSVSGAAGRVAIAPVGIPLPLLASAALIAAAWFLGFAPALLAAAAYAAFVLSADIPFSPAQIAQFSLFSLMPFALALTSALSKRVYLPALLAGVPGLLLAGFYAAFSQGIFTAVEFMGAAFAVLFSLALLPPLAVIMMWLAKDRKKAG